MLESQQRLDRDTPLQASFFEQGASLFDEMVLPPARQVGTIRCVPSHSSSEPRSTALGSPAAACEEHSGMKASARSAPLDPEELAGKLTRGCRARLLLVLWPDRIFTWVLTRDGDAVFDRSLPGVSSSRSLRLRGGDRSEGSRSATREASRALVRRVGASAVAGAARHSDSLVLVPDESCSRVPLPAFGIVRRGRLSGRGLVSPWRRADTVFVQRSTARGSSGRWWSRPSRARRRKPRVSIARACRTCQPRRGGGQLRDRQALRGSRPAHWTEAATKTGLPAEATPERGRALRRPRALRASGRAANA